MLANLTVASTITKMPDQLLDNPKPLHKPRDPDVETNAAGGAATVPQVSINRSTVAELERRRILHIQAAALMILATAAVLSLIYVAKLILVVILISSLAVVRAGAAGRPDGSLPDSPRRRRHGRRAVAGGRAGRCQLCLLQPGAGLHARGADVQSQDSGYGRQDPRASSADSTDRGYGPVRRSGPEDRYRQAVEQLDRPGQPQCQLGVRADAGR